jgi:CDP-paratose 2-epimerase
MSVIVITGSAGLIGSEASTYFAKLGYEIVGIDNDQRRVFFGDNASTHWNRVRLESELGAKYHHHDTDIRDEDAINRIFQSYRKDIAAVIHTASQPSHDWAATNPMMDFSINAVGTMCLLEATRKLSLGATFIFTSTNKVYGDTPNRLPLKELDKRWEIESGHEYEGGITETMSVDHCIHSLFGVSKLAADSAVQEYGKYFDMHTVSFRGGCLTGPNHSGAEGHGFLAYLVKCAATGAHYKVYGYKGKQVRDNIHSLDLVRAFHEVIKKPRMGEVYNIGGGRSSNCSMLEAIEIAESICGKPMDRSYVEQNRTGDHIWWISSNDKFMQHYPGWKVELGVGEIMQEIFDHNAQRWAN